MRPTQPIRDILTGPERWTQRWAARDADGNSESPFSDRAVCWCLMGAALKADISRPMRGALHRACGGDAATYNDAPGRTFEEILVKLDHADRLLS